MFFFKTAVFIQWEPISFSYCASAKIKGGSVDEHTFLLEANIYLHMLGYIASNYRFHIGNL